MDKNEQEMKGLQGAGPNSLKYKLVCKVTFAFTLNIFQTLSYLMWDF